MKRTTIETISDIFDVDEDVNTVMNMINYYLGENQPNAIVRFTQVIEKFTDEVPVIRTFDKYIKINYIIGFWESEYEQIPI